LVDNLTGGSFTANRLTVSLPGTFHVWLASPEAHFLKGRFLWANWDVEELKANAKEIEASEKFKIGLTGWPFGDAQWQFGGHFKHAGK
jgi:hypothetical protein